MINRSRFIPFRKADIVEMCIGDKRLSDTEKKEFRDFCKILEAVFHFEFHERLETLKNCFSPFNPDSDTQSFATYTDEDKAKLQKKLVSELATVLEAANFEKITTDDIKQALGEESLFKIRLEVNFDDFEDIIFFRRGETIKQETLVKFFGLQKKNITFTNYDRVLVYVKFRDQKYFDSHKRKDLYFEPGSTLIKLFQNIPKADLEMLFPNSEVRMKPMDKIIIGVPAAISGVVVLASKLGASLILVGSVLAFWLGFTDKDVQINQQHLIALGAGLGALGGFLFRQISKFKNRKIKFMKALADNLYFKNLDNNAGVFYHLIDAAEEEEFKEAVLAYYFLLTEKSKLTPAQLDNLIERWFADNWNCQIDFEVEDALKKLERLELVNPQDNILHGKTISEAKRQLDLIWDNYFEYHQAG
jgi:hypothetical protein